MSWKRVNHRFVTAVIIGIDILIVLALAAGLLSLRSSSVILNGSEGSNPLDSSQAQNDKTYRLLFSGDIMLDRYVKRQIMREQDPLYPFLRIASTTRAADLTIANLEGPVTDRGVKSGSEYSFRFEPVGTVNALTYAGIDIVSSANNHIYDYGQTGLLDTITNLRAAGIEPVGIGANSAEANTPVIKLLGDTRVAFISYTDLYPDGLVATAGQPGISNVHAMTQVISDLKRLQEADIIVVLFHGGIEYQTHSNKGQEQIAHAAIDAGADLFIGTHPHVVQEVEHYKNGWIAYSLGNFVFDQNFSAATMSAIMAQATIQNHNVIDFKTIPIKISSTFQPYIRE